jgi:hypothetical protein
MLVSVTDVTESTGASGGSVRPETNKGAKTQTKHDSQTHRRTRKERESQRVIHTTFISQK